MVREEKAEWGLLISQYFYLGRGGGKMYILARGGSCWDITLTILQQIIDQLPQLIDGEILVAWDAHSIH